jgi:NADH-quinone oxidoreductase subunit F
LEKRLNTISDLESLRASLIEERDPKKLRIALCGGTGCLASGAREVADAFKEELEKQKVDGQVDFRESGCHGFCERGPLVVMRPKNIFYQLIQPKDVPEIVTKTIKEGEIIDRLLYVDPTTGEKVIHENDVPFYKLQKRIVFGSNGEIDPTSIQDYIAIGGYAALAKALSQMSPEEIIEEVKASGLRGRGGGGFPAGVKWESCRKAHGNPKYVICNADEGDPGAYMDRSLLEGNPGGNDYWGLCHRISSGIYIREE